MYYATLVTDEHKKPRAFWLDFECQPFRRFDEETGKDHEVTSEEEKIDLMDHNVRVSATKSLMYGSNTRT
jgi:hypothetical protein